VPQIYRSIFVPTIEPTSIGSDGLPHTSEGILQTVEQHWLGAEGAKLVSRHIEDGVLQLERSDLKYLVSARTVGGIPCPIVWGVSVEGQKPEDDILEPHLLAPEGSEVVININGRSPKRTAILGIFDQESPQPGMPPIRTPLLSKDGEAQMYVGNQVVFWKDNKYGNLRVVTPVKSVGGDLFTIEDGSAEVALHGGLYVIIVPEKNSIKIINLKPAPDYFGSDALRDFDFGTSRDGATMGGDSLLRGGGMTKGGADLFTRGRAGGLVQGETVARGGMTEFEPEAADTIPFILRVRATGEMPSYLAAAGVATSTEHSIHVKGAVCAHCGINAPKESYTWKGDEFHFDQFDCNRCGGGTLEPVQYKKRAQKQ